MSWKLLGLFQGNTWTEPVIPLGIIYLINFAILLFTNCKDGTARKSNPAAVGIGRNC